MNTYWSGRVDVMSGAFLRPKWGLGLESPHPARSANHPLPQGERVISKPSPLAGEGGEPKARGAEERAPHPRPAAATSPRWGEVEAGVLSGSRQGLTPRPWRR